MAQLNIDRSVATGRSAQYSAVTWSIQQPMDAADALVARFGSSSGFLNVRHFQILGGYGWVSFKFSHLHILALLFRSLPFFVPHVIVIWSHYRYINSLGQIYT